ncbi:MAG TPA: ShlB/FhaC/HecB family hemolysin secretion/activation protein [Rhizomicrobium sp.]|nr:ShlB/FhaC/HecB family hemolysin secretion/activation protein [Rhizomicrobium sp.]
MGWTLPTVALAAPVNLPGAVQPGHERTLPQPQEIPDIDFSVEAPHRSAVPRAVDEIRFKVLGIKIEGAQSIKPESFRPLYEPLIGKEVSLRDVFDVADGIEKQYRAAGYLLVRAYVPPQHVNDGIFTIRVVEGFVESTSVDGGNGPTRDLVKNYLDPIVHQKPLRSETIEHALLLANNIPGVTATGVLSPSPNVPGAANLTVTVTQPTISGSLATMNRGSQYTGVWTVSGAAAYRGIVNADELDTAFTWAPFDFHKQVAGQVRYVTQLNDDGLAGTFLGAVSHGAPGGSLGPIEVRTDSWAIGPRLSYPLKRSRSDTLTIDGGITIQDASVDILGIGISHDKWRVADISLAYSSRDFLAGNFAGTFDVAEGLPILGATPNHSPNLSIGGQTTFTKASWQARYSKSVGSNFSVGLSSTGQYSFAPLLTGEQVLFGGTQIGRGYEPGAISGDSGLGGSVELRYDTRLTDLAIKSLEPYAFFDTAKVWNKDRPASLGLPLSDYAIASTGIGLRFWFPYSIYLAVEGARTLHPVPGSDNGKAVNKALLDLAIAF